jgi:hypothetical protein
VPALSHPYTSARWERLSKREDPGLSHKPVCELIADHVVIFDSSDRAVLIDRLYFAKKGWPSHLSSFSLSFITWGTPSQFEFTFGTVAGIFADDTPGIPADLIRAWLLDPFVRICRSYSSKAFCEGSFMLKKLRNAFPFDFDGVSIFLRDGAEEGAMGDRAVGIAFTA